MLRRYLQVTCLGICLLAATAAKAQGGKVIVDGKAYTVHQVLTGETFYSIALTYKVHVDSLRNVNRLADATAAIRPGDMLIIPLHAVKGEAAPTAVPATAPSPAPVVATPPAAIGGYLAHTVVTGETLYSVARQYPYTTVAAIKELNHLEVEGLSIGQMLLIPAPGTAPAITRPVAPVAPPANQPVDTNAIYKPSGALPGNTHPNATVSNAEDSNEATAASFDMIMLRDFERKYQADVASGKQETVTGTATWITDPSHENQYRFYAMHKTAPIGSVVMVKNLMNDRVVYAKVIGKLPNTRANEKIIVKLSGGAARFLNVLDDKFMVELSMVTQNPISVGQ